MKPGERVLTQEEIKKAAVAYLDGNSLRGVAKSLNNKVSHVTLQRYFLEDLSKIDFLLSREVIDALKDNAPMSINDNEVFDRVLKSYHLYVNEGLSLNEISQILNVSFFTTYRDLERRLFLLYEAHPEFVTKEMVEIVKNKMRSHRLGNLNQGNNAYLTEQRNEQGRFSR